MADDNRVSANLTAAQITAILAAVQAIHAEVDSFTVSISSQDRQEIPKMGSKSVGFDDKCEGYMASNPEFLPGFIDPAEITKDRGLRAQLLQFIPQLRTLMEGLEDTLMVVNSELWMADLAYYQSVREAKRRGRTGADTIFNDLRERFPGTPQAVPTDPTGPNP